MMTERDQAAIAAFEKGGGTAFPAEYSVPSGGSITCPGMSLRDWFAGQAMAARIQALGAHQHASEAECLECKAQTARRAYEHADAMLKERAR